MILELDLIKRIVKISHTHIHAWFIPKGKFLSFFRGLGKLQGECTIELEDNATPLPHRVTFPLLKTTQKELEQIEKMEVIARMNRPTQWCSGMVMVPKPHSS